METVKLIKSFGSSAYKLMGKTLSAAEKLCGLSEPLERIPIVGGTVADLHDTVSMLNDYYNGSYRRPPFAAMLGAVIIVAYVASPIDLIPDGLPVLGFVDDAFIVNAILGLCLDAELKRYRQWCSEQEQ